MSNFFFFGSIEVNGGNFIGLMFYVMIGGFGGGFGGMIFFFVRMLFLKKDFVFFSVGGVGGNGSGGGGGGRIYFYWFDIFIGDDYIFFVIIKGMMFVSFVLILMFFVS